MPPTRTFAHAARLALAAGAALSFSAACSSSSDTPAAPKYPTADAYCAARAEAECAVSDLCTVKKDACVTKRKSVCTASISAAAGPGREYDPAGAEACVATVSFVYKADKALIKSDELRSLDGACAKVFSGKTEKNKACEVSSQCLGTLVCDRGFCAEIVQKGPDTPCGNPGETCVPGYVCQGDPLKTCVRRKLKDELCVGADSCVEGLLCNGTCKDKLPVGEVCVSSADCASGLCDTTSSGKKCTAGLTFAGGGDTCKQYGG